MPLTKKGSKVLSAMQREYGKKKGQSVFYASINAGKLTGAEGRKKKSAWKRGNRYLFG